MRISHLEVKLLHEGVTQAKVPEAVNTYLQKPKNVYQFRRRIPGPPYTDGEV